MSCHVMACVICHMFFCHPFSQTKVWILLVERTFSTGPTMSSFTTKHRLFYPCPPNFTTLLLVMSVTFQNSLFIGFIIFIINTLFILFNIFNLSVYSLFPVYIQSTQYSQYNLSIQSIQSIQYIQLIQLYKFIHSI